MGVLRVLLIIIEVVVCILLVGIILLQKSKSSGLGVAFGSGMGESLFGAQAGNVLTKATVILAAIFLVNTTLLALVQPPADTSLADRMLPAADAPPVRPDTRPPPVDQPLPDTTPHELPAPDVPPPADTVPPSVVPEALPPSDETVMPPMDIPMETPADPEVAVPAPPIDESVPEQN